MKKIRLFVYYLVFVLVGISCSEDKAGVPLDYPSEVDQLWEYDIFQIVDEDTSEIGEVITTNVGMERFEGRDNVINLDRIFRYDSLQGTNKQNINQSSFLHVSDGNINIYAETYFEFFEGLLSANVLDSLSRNGDGEEYQQFSFIEPEWMTLLNFGNDPETSSYNHTTYRVFLDFYYRTTHITGEVRFFTKNKFSQIDVIPYDTLNLITYKFNTITYFDYDLYRDSIKIPTFRNTLEIDSWYHRSGGLIKRQRSEYELYVTQVPSRFPIVYIPEEYWMLRRTEQVVLD